MAAIFRSTFSYDLQKIKNKERLGVPYFFDQCYFCVDNIASSYE